MPIFASFEGVDQLGSYLLGAAFLLVCWIVSAIAALGALVLGLCRTRGAAALTWARASVLASIPVALFCVWAGFQAQASGDPVASWPFLAVSLAPLALGLGVWGFALRTGRRNAGEQPGA